MRLLYLCPRCQGGISFGAVGVGGVIGAVVIGFLPLVLVVRMPDAACWLLAALFVAGVCSGVSFMLATVEIFGRPKRRKLPPDLAGKARQLDRVAATALPRLMIFMGLFTAAVLSMTRTHSPRGAQIQDRAVCLSFTLATLGAVLGLAEAIRATRAAKGHADEQRDDAGGD